MKQYLTIQKITVGTRYDDFSVKTKIPIVKLTPNYIYFLEEDAMRISTLSLSKYHVSTNKKIRKYKREVLTDKHFYHDLGKSEASIINLNVENEDGTYLNYVSEKECISFLKEDLEIRLSLYLTLYENIEESYKNMK